MSRIGKLPVKTPAGVKARFQDPLFEVEGPKGRLSLEVKPPCAVELEEGEVRVTRPDDSRQSKAAQGLYRSLIHNLVVGVSEGFERKLEIVGVGYRAEVAGRTLKLSLGFASPKEFPIPEGIEIAVEKDVIVVRGIDRTLVGDVAARIRAHRPPEPYKGKGIRYQGELVKRKAGKSGVGGGAPGGR